MGRTIVIVLHDINFAGHYSDHICAVKSGSVVEFGTPEEIMTPEVLTRVFDTPVEVIDGPRGRLAVYY
ncbi:MAG: ABC transporter ATP-binding protein, partial [Brevibacterium sp.]